MTFFPQVLTKDDPNNSTPNINPGNATQTTGYNSLIITITGATGSCSIEVQYSNDTNTSNFSTFYMDSILTGSAFIKSYSILKNYYRIKFTGTATSVQSRLSAQSYQSNTTNTINTFENSIENTMDAFGKLRVSNPNTLLDIRVPGQDASGIGATGTTSYLQNDMQICYGVSGSGGLGATAYKLCNNSQSDIFVDGNLTFINQSRKYCTYQPGKSLLIMASGVLDARSILEYGITDSTGNTPGIKSRVGYFDQYNGLYFEYDSGNGCSICVKSKGELKYNSPIRQTDWNIDQMNGSGTSGLTLEFTKAQLFVIDLEWLGVGRIRFGFYAYGRIQYCHEILNINQISIGPYTYNINLPIRYELQGMTGATGAMIQICSTVISEGGYTPVGKPFSINIYDINAPLNNTETSILFLRGGSTKGNFYHQQILPTDFSIVCSAVGDVGILKINLYLPNAGTSISNNINWLDVNSNSVVQYGTSGGITLGNAINTTVYQSAFSGRGSSSFSDLGNVFTDLLQINSDINNNSSILEITITGNFGGSSKIYATLSWSEIY
jgi:hypothetical protein